jgi:uncharacterized membrane protein YhhN
VLHAGLLAKRVAIRPLTEVVPWAVSCGVLLLIGVGHRFRLLNSRRVAYVRLVMAL